MSVEQRAADMDTLGQWILKRGGSFNPGNVVLWYSNEPKGGARLYSEFTHGPDWLHHAAEWVRNQEAVG
jgi:hypothetical protein